MKLNELKDTKANIIKGKERVLNLISNVLKLRKLNVTRTAYNGVPKVLVEEDLKLGFEVLSKLGFLKYKADELYKKGEVILKVEEDIRFNRLHITVKSISEYKSFESIESKFESFLMDIRNKYELSSNYAFEALYLDKVVEVLKQHLTIDQVEVRSEQYRIYYIVGSSCTVKFKNSNDYVVIKVEILA